MKIKILGVKIDDISLDEAVEVVRGWLKGGGKHYMVTPNPEILMAAQKDPVFRKILNDADLSIPDGVGLNLTGKIKNRISGTDLMEKLVDKSRDWTTTIGLLGGRNGVAEKVAECLKNKYPGLQVVFAENGLAAQHFLTGLDFTIPKVDLLFVAFGHPKQEKWIYQNLPHIPVKVAMGVGGAFDYLSGRVPRAPRWIRSMGLEWLFRLIIQPWRIKRQLALLKFIKNINSF